MRRLPLLAVCAAVAAVALTACSSTSSGAADRPPVPGTILSANSTKQLGTTVVDGSVYTLYRFDGDSAEPSATTCVDECAEQWPPMLADPAAPPVLEGIDEEAFGTVTRPDGTAQVTIGGWPVYRHAADPAPGSTDGNGVDGAWFAIKPDGSKAAPPPGAN